MRALKAIIALLFVLAGIIIGALNQQSVDIDLFFFHYQAHIGLALILSLLAGAVIGGALVSVSGSSVSSVAGISVRQAFFAPAIGITPFSSAPPRTRIESIVPPHSFFVSFSAAAALARACALRRAILAFSAAFRRSSRADTAPRSLACPFGTGLFPGPSEVCGMSPFSVMPLC